MKTIGIIGGTTWHSTAEYYRVINEKIAERLGGQHSARILLYSVDFHDHIARHTALGWDGVFDELHEIVQILTEGGADFLLLAANTLHKVAADLQESLEVPVLHIARACGQAISKSGIRTLALLGTRYTMREDFYTSILRDSFNLDILIPEKTDFDTIDHLIYHEMAVGNFGDAVRKQCLDVMERLVDRGAEGIILGCTELPKLMAGISFQRPLFDTLEIHAEAAAEFALL